MSILETKIDIPALRFVTKSLRIQGTVIAPRSTNIDMLKFASDNGIRPIVQQFPLSVQGITKAMDLMKEGKLEYRAIFVAE
jgi:D-arabinose 1-dehydrogenase-like Zn-dependent alcohol dehydrogenase